MPMFHAYCQNSAEHAKLANQVSISMNKTLKPSLRGKFTATFYYGSGHYYYFINPIRVLSCPVLDDRSIIDSRAMPRYIGEYRRDYVYSDDEYNRDIFVSRSLLYVLSSIYPVKGRRVLKTDTYKKSFFRQLYTERDRYKLDGVYINDTEGWVAMIKAGLKTGDIVSIDNRECFLIKVKHDHDDYSFWAIAID